jgi:hypothetical protein
VASKDPRDPTWQYISLALIRGRTFARSRGHRWKGDSCFFVSSLALGLVMQTRNGSTTWSMGDGGPTLPTDDPTSIDLAYADHYLNMRASTGFWGKPGYVSNQVATQGYDLAKKAIFGLKSQRTPFPELSPNPLNPASLMPDSVKLVQAFRSIFGGIVAPLGDAMGSALQESPSKPLSAPTVDSVFWANQGNFDGMIDFKGSSIGAELEALQKYNSDKKTAR